MSIGFSSLGSRTATAISLASMNQPSTDQISQGSSGSDTGSTSTRTHQNISLSSLLESVLNALEEPKGIIYWVSIDWTQCNLTSYVIILYYTIIWCHCNHMMSL